MIQKAECKQRDVSKYYANIFLTTILVLIIYIITKRYIDQESFIYSWDYVGYQKSTDILIDEFGKSFLSGILEFINALFSDYSKLFCIPILPFYLAFGESRFSFILSLALVYVTSFSLIMGVVFSNIVKNNRWGAFWIAAFITLFTPAVWVSVLRGYPDIGGATIFMLGILLYWKDSSLKQRNLPLKIAALMSILVLFRRHFAYAFRSFLITIFLQNIINIRIKKIAEKNKGKIDISSIKRLSLVLILFLVFSIHLPIKTFYFNYRELYSSYEESITTNIGYYGSSFGPIFILLAVTGFTTGLVHTKFDQKKLEFLGLLGLVSILQWLVSSKQIGVHYASHFLPFIILGISTLIWSTDKILMRLGNKFKSYALAIATALQVFLLLLNFNIGIANTSLNIKSLQPLFARQEAPLTRSDYPEVVHFIKYLKDNLNAEDSIYVAASSYGVLNKSIVEEGEKSLYKEQKLNIIRTSDIDSRDFYPLNGLLNAHYVVVTDPIQYHINSEQQKVITVIGNLFKDKQLIANDFEKVPEQFSFQDGVTGYLYKRIKPTSTETILSTLHFMEQKINRKLGRETYWLALDSGQGTVIERDALFKTIHISPLSIKSKYPVSLLYFGELYPITKVNGKINIMSRCSQTSPILLHSTTLSTERKAIEEKTITYIPKNQTPFEFSLDGQNAKFLELKLEFQNSKTASDACMIALNHVVVSNQK
jgi:hypothetical protein